MTAINTCHLSNIAIRLNQEIKWDASTQTVLDNPIAKPMQARDFRKGYEIEM